jgi:hypothetical protein
LYYPFYTKQLVIDKKVGFCFPALAYQRLTYQNQFNGEPMISQSSIKNLSAIQSRKMADRSVTFTERSNQSSVKAFSLLIYAIVVRRRKKLNMNDLQFVSIGFNQF